MKQFNDTLRTILEEGTWQDNRTGVRSKFLPGMSMRFDLTKGFPAVTGKRLFFGPVKGELCAFMRGSSNSAEFRALGSKVWDGNANGEGKPGYPNLWLTNPFRRGEDDLGAIYGVQWRRWPAFKFFEQLPSVDISKKLEADGWVYRGQTGENMSRDADDFKSEGYLWTKEIDQLGDCMRTIIKNPTDRRILFHAWNPAQLNEMALPPCHLLYQFLPNVTTKELSMTLYIRSNDMFLGSPFNIAEGALLLELVARLTGYKAKWFSYFVGDAHIYENSVDQVNLQLSREPFPSPTISISDRVPTFADFQDELASQSSEPWYEESLGERAVGWLSHVQPSHFTLEGYQSHEAISAEMVV